MSKEMIKIKPCPFCAGVNVYPAYANQPATHFYCKCLDCGANGPKIERQSGADEYSEAVEKWNQRASTIVEVKHGPYDEIYELITEGQRLYIDIPRYMQENRMLKIKGD